MIITPNKRLTGLARMSMNNMPIRYKLILHFLLISILPSIGLGFLVNWSADRVIERRMTENTLQLIGKVNQTLEAYVENLQNITYFISFNPEVQDFLKKGTAGTGSRIAIGSPQPESGAEPASYAIRKFLQGFTTLHSEVAGILIVNRRGAYLSNEMYARYPNQSLTEEEWYLEAVRNKGIFKIVGHPSGRNVTTHASYKDNEVVSVVRAILDPETGETLGVVLIDLKLRVIAETAQDVRLGKTGYLTVLDPGGEMIYAPPEPYVGKIPLSWLKSQSGAGTSTHEVNGRKLQFIYRESAFTGWTTVGVFSLKESAAETREIRFSIVSFVFFVCLLGMTASFYLAYSLSRPIGQLMSFMQKAQAGDLTVRHWGNRSDEIGLLGRKFNAMLQQINRLIKLTERQERQKREAELRSLQAHIKPHFLYNTLDTIHWMARRKGAEDIAQLAESLSKLFRIGLSKGNDIIPLNDEIEHIRSYLQIQQVRYQNKLSYSIDIDPRVQGAYVLKLILQPIVENAIYHGIKERRGPGRVEIRGSVRNGGLELTVRDDGKGMNAERLLALRRSLAAAGTAEPAGAASEPGPAGGNGYGMLNVQARIALTFGNPYGISVESEEGEGTTVTVTHPILTEPLLAKGAGEDGE
ncbi:sensor histidine kinase [Paenibacillus sanfengchensis]|uniref:cache domain-containing sensor histidine kinase n=1 Tax=Paenibacillus sanfengchensis TaxID=3119819 RepID=UPI002FDFC280